MTTPSPHTLKTSTAQRLSALALSAVLTLGMLAGVNQIAVSDAPAALIAQTGPARG